MEQHDLSTEIVQRGLESSGPYAGSQSFSVRVRRRMPNFLGSVNLKHVKLGYHYLLNHKIYLITAPVVVLAAALFFRADVTSGGLLFLKYCDNVDASPATKLVVGLVFIAVGFSVYGFVRAGGVRSTYLVDFACYRPPEHLKITRSEFVELAKKSGQFSHEAIEFQHRLLKTSGIGDESYMPRSIFSPGKRIVLREGREEAALVVFGAIDALLASTNINPNTIRILVVNCGVLNTTPSLSAMIINHYKLRPNTNNINLGGMGCSGGVVALDLARDLLHSSSSSPFSFGTYALVVSTEIVSSTWYSGNDFAMLAPNCYLRMGAAAMLVSNRWVDRWRAKYELKQVVRTHRGGVDNNSFGCVELREDASGNQGLWVADQHQLFQVGGNALKANMSTLGPLVLPLKEQLLFFKSLLFNTPTGGTGGPYIPDYKSAFEHVCIGASSNRVLDEVQKNLGLTDAYMDASRSTLRRLGNTSSSSVWYQLEFLEGKGRVRRGHRVWQVAMGSGFKCNSMVWKALRNIN